MKKFQMILLLCAIFILPNHSGIASHALVLRFDPECAQLTERGIVVNCYSIPDVCVDNVQFDEKGCWTKINFELACRLCGSCAFLGESNCQICGSHGVECVPSSNGTSYSFSSHEEILGELGDVILEEMGRVYAKGEANDKGEAHVEAGVEGENLYVKGIVDSEGESSIEAGYEDEDFYAKGSVNSEGETEIEVGCHGESEDGSIGWSGSASVKRDKDGSTTAEAEASINF